MLETLPVRDTGGQQASKRARPGRSNIDLLKVKFMFALVYYQKKRAEGGREREREVLSDLLSGLEGTRGEKEGLHHNTIY